MGKDDQWQTTSCQPDALETRTQTHEPETFLFRTGSRGQTENILAPPPLKTRYSRSPLTYV